MLFTTRLSRPSCAIQLTIRLLPLIDYLSDIGARVSLNEKD